MAALMTCDSHDLTKVAKIIRESQVDGHSDSSSNVNEAGVTFVATANGIRFAMSGIKGVGTGVVEAIVEEREKRGPFANFYHFFERIDAKRVGKKTIENLVDAGSFDFTGWSRDALRQSIETMYDTAAKEQKEHKSGVMNLFALMGEKTSDRFSKPPVVKIKSSKIDILRKEKVLLGFFLTGHPMDEYKDILKRLSCVPMHRIPEMDHDAVFRAAFIVESVNVRISAKTQRKFAILMISDGMESFELPIWSDLYDEKHHLLLENQLLYAVLQVDKREETTRISCRWLGDLSQVNEEMVQVCDQALDKAKHQATRFNHIKAKAEAAPPKPVKEEKMSKLTLSFDANNTRLGHMLKLKIFSKSIQEKALSK